MYLRYDLKHICLLRMLRDITNTAVKIKMLSATPMLSAIAQPQPLCYLPHLWWDRISISNYNNSCIKQTKFHIVTCLENFGDFGLLRRPKINVLAVLLSSWFSGTMRVARKKKINFLIREAYTVKKLTIWKIAIEWGDVATPLNEIHWILTFPRFSHIFPFWIPSTSINIIFNVHTRTVLLSTQYLFRKNACNTLPIFLGGIS